MMKSTIATILGTAAIGILKKQMGSSTRLYPEYGYTGSGYFSIDLLDYRKTLGISEQHPDQETIDSAYIRLHDATEIPYGTIVTGDGYRVDLEGSLARPEDTDASIYVRENEMTYQFAFLLHSTKNSFTEQQKKELFGALERAIINKVMKSILNNPELIPEYYLITGPWWDWGRMEQYDGNWFDEPDERSSRVINADTGEEYKPKMKVSKLRKR
jgi:hypothetical protein